MISRTTNIVACIFTAIVAIAAFGVWWLYTIPFSKSTLRRLGPGMTQAQVYAVLGRASQTNQLGTNETWWIYSRRPSLVHLCVIFDSTGSYKSHVID
jgi:outer membrane protein assembly factor BamE (lipoprotein component of BamABCDE complex)